MIFIILPNFIQLEILIQLPAYDLIATPDLDSFPLDFTADSTYLRAAEYLYLKSILGLGIDTQDSPL